ncbi:MAG: membrane protein insertase YidC [Fimbriimonadaceae bacterium]|nr:membrane protein insertase YidC [Fimbriimonadaceae bacterium]
MSQANPQRQAQRSMNLAILMLVTAFMLWMTRPRANPQQGAATAPTANPPAASSLLTKDAAARLQRGGAPVFVGDLVLRDSAWKDLQPADQVAAIRTRLKNAAKDDPGLPQYHLTIAYLYETALKDLTQAASEYSALGRWVQPDKAKGGKVAAYLYAAQAKLRAAELYQQLYEQGQDPQYKKKARKELDLLATDLQRYGAGAVMLWRRQGEQWVAVSQDLRAKDNTYGYVLQRIDALTRDSTMYKILHSLVRLCGGQNGFSMTLALVLLAIGLKLAMFPLSRKSYRSMAEMQRLQPVVQELQKKHKDNPQKLNQEMMAIYAEHGVNPLGGCLPMVLQIPVFIFVYQGIRAYTLHYHQQPFLWVPSLAGPDLPLLLLYGISMFVTQWLTMKRQPKPADPSQAQMQQMMGWMMPIMFTYMMYLWNLPSAFYLYWLTFNILGAVEQWYIHKTKPAAPAAVVVAPLGEAPRPTPARKAGRTAPRKKHRSGRGG